jgi:glycerol-3-phosphate dehydrogenase
MVLLMQAKPIDLLVIGGGINGVGVAADAAGRGLSVVLCEQDDLANHTSSASSKLIHGGLRYLEQYDFRLVREALAEREVLLNIAPHLVHPISFIFPVHHSRRPAWLIRLGLFIYDHLSHRKKIPASKSIKPTDLVNSGLKNKFKRAFEYWDCQTDDARLVIANALSAQRFSAEILTRTKVTSIELTAAGWLVTTDTNRVFIAQSIVNAAGAWVAQVHQMATQKPAQTSLTWVKGSHIVIPHVISKAYLLQTQDQRVVFVIPYAEKYTMIGTTDVVYCGDLSRVTIDPEERDYLIQVYNEYFEDSITASNIIYEFSGIRSLLGTPKAGAANMRRGYALEQWVGLNKFPIISVFGGKLTSYRLLAEAVMKELLSFFPGVRPAWTKYLSLPGGELMGLDYGNWLKKLIADYPNIPTDLLTYYAKNYGSLSYKILGNASASSSVSTDDVLGMCFGPLCYQKEIDYLIEHEWAMDLNDILWRRTKHGLSLTPQQQEELTKYIKRLY